MKMKYIITDKKGTFRLPIEAIDLDDAKTKAKFMKDNNILSDKIHFVKIWQYNEENKLIFPPKCSYDFRTSNIDIDSLWI